MAEKKFCLLKRLYTTIHVQVDFWIFFLTRREYFKETHVSLKTNVNELNVITILYESILINNCLADDNFDLFLNVGVFIHNY